MKKNKAFFLLIFLLCIQNIALTQNNNDTLFHIASLIQDNMVIQQGKPFIIWGQGHTVEGRYIVVQTSWNKKIYKASCDVNNTWKVQVDVPAATLGDFTPQTITITHDNQSTTINNILIGEVWLCSGQSNMDFQLKEVQPWLRGVIDFDKEIAAADYPSIRLFDVRTDFKATPQKETQGHWSICSPETVGDFSAVAYYFGRKIFQQLNIPVGLIVTSVGGSKCEAWTSRDVLKNDNILKEKYLDPYDKKHANDIIDSTVTFEKVFSPTLLYNAMLAPLTNYSIKGFLWYQGESNKDDKMLYTRLNKAMIESWRSDFNQGVLAFYYVQIAPYFYNDLNPLAHDAAEFRDAQDSVQLLENTGMICTMDIGDSADIHPRQKKEVGERLAMLALAKTYKQKNIPFSGPRFDYLKTDGNKIKICFKPETVKNGLITNDNNPPKYFFVAGNDMEFFPANATIENHEIILQSDLVKHPVAVHYAYTNSAVTNLCNKEGFPVFPFRTDNWISPLDTISFSIKEDTAFTKLVTRDHGWFGADGIFTIPLNGVDSMGKDDSAQKRMIIFSDTVIGDVVDNKPDTGVVMAHNSCAILEGRDPMEDKINFYWNQTKGERLGRNPGSLFVPDIPGTDTSHYYWLGDGFVNHAKNNDIYISGVRVKDTGDVFAFGFKEDGNAFIIIPAGSKPPFVNARQIQTPFYIASTDPKDPFAYGSFGGAFYDNTKEAGAPNPDGYLYMYGVRGKNKALMVARVMPKDMEDFTQWKYWDGNDWNTAINKVANVTDRVSNEMSITPLPDGRYALIFQLDGLGRFVGMRLSNHLQGPFGPPIKLYEVGDDVLKSPNYFPYNAKAHPALSKPGELIITYNVNSFNFWGGDIQKDGHLYRPRFLKLKLYDKK